MAHKIALTKGKMTIHPDGSAEITVVHPNEPDEIIRLTYQQMFQVCDSWIPIWKAKEAEKASRRLIVPR